MDLSISFSHFYHIYKLSLSKPCIFHKFTEKDSEVRPLYQRLSLWESWCEAPERARALTGKHRHGDGIALTKRQLIAVRRLSGEAFARRRVFHTFSTQKGRRPFPDSALCSPFLFVILHPRVDGAGAVDLFREDEAGQLVGHRDAAHAELERRRTLDLL